MKFADNQATTQRKELTMHSYTTTESIEAAESFVRNTLRGR